MAIMTGRVTARIGSGKGGEVREKEGRRQVSALSSSIPDFCFPAPEMQFEPIKSMVSRGLSPIGAERGRKRSLKLVGDTDGKCMVIYFRFEIQEEFMTTTVQSGSSFCENTV